MASRTAYSTSTPQKPTLFDGHYLRNPSTLDIGVLGYIGIVQHKEHSPEFLSIPPGTTCICCTLYTELKLVQTEKCLKRQLITGGRFQKRHFVLIEDGTRVPTHVGDKCLMFICN